MAKEVRVTIVGDDKLSPAVKSADASAGGFANALKMKLAPALEGILEKFPAVGKAAKKFGIDTDSILSGAVPVAAAAAGTAIAGFVTKSIGDFQDGAQAVLHYKQVAGGTAEDASRWVAAFDDYGLSADEAATLVGRLAKTAEDSPSKLEKYGAAVVHAKDGSIILNSTLLSVIDALHNAPDEASRAALGTAAFGKGWQSMAKVIDAGAKDVLNDFDSISGGQIFSEDDLKNSEDFRLALDDLSDALQGLEDSIGSAALPTLTKLLHVLKDVGTAADLVPEPLVKIAETAAKFNPLALPYTAAAAALDALAGSSDKDVVALGKLNKATGQIVGSVEDHTAEEKIAADAIAASQKATEEATKANEDAAKATEEHRKALAALDDELASNTNALLGAQSAQIKTNQAIGEYKKQADDATVSTEDHTLALNDMTTQIIETASKTGDAATANTTFATETDKASASIDAQIGYLAAVRDTLAPDDPLRANLNAYIDELNGIKSKINTEVTADTEEALRKLRELQNYIASIAGGYDIPIGLASGGDIPHAASGSDTGAFLVGEQGPELFVPATAGHIFPANSKFGNATAGSGGATYVTINALMSDDQVVRALKRWTRKNGQLPI